MNTTKAKIIGISRHRLVTDGDGVTTLVAFHDCPLRCRFCLNPHSLGNGDRFSDYTPASLYSATVVDEIYFLATGGGITFGGGEPCLRPEFITKFRQLCGDLWQLNVETSLNVPTTAVAAILPVVNTLIIDVKDMDPDIYMRYTGRDNNAVIENLSYIASVNRQDDCIIRVPLIPGFNDDQCRQRSRARLSEMGYTRFDFFTYKTD